MTGTWCQASRGLEKSNCRGYSCSSQHLVLSQTPEMSCHRWMVSPLSCHLCCLQGRRAGSCVETSTDGGTCGLSDPALLLKFTWKGSQACCQHWGRDTPSGLMATSR